MNHAKTILCLVLVFQGWFCAYETKLLAFKLPACVFRGCDIEHYIEQCCHGEVGVMHAPSFAVRMRMRMKMRNLSLQVHCSRCWWNRFVCQSGMLRVVPAFGSWHLLGLDGALI